VIYLVKVEGTLEELARLFQNLDKTVKTTRKTVKNVKSVAKKVKRKVSPYQREVGRQLKRLKAKHPRTNVTSLMKRAHRAAKKARK
tara:strand:- start:757 stop:1014 length:258 start_codon:yes stop_codon:yes gene_type:complete